ncbi:HIT family protein [Ostreibacterium oceani]
MSVQVSVADCLFCKMVQGDIAPIKVYEDDNVMVIMDIFPESKGHLLIIPKAHYDDLLTMPSALLTAVMALSQRLAVAAKAALAADGIKIVQYNGKAAGQTVFHYHMHVIPAYTGQPFARHATKPADEDELRALANRIADNLRD